MKLIISLILFKLALPIKAALLTPTQLLIKCSLDLTGKYPALENLKEIKSHELAIDHCLKALQKTVIEGKTGLLKIKDKETISVLNHFDRLHKSFLMIRKLPNISNRPSYENTLEHLDPLGSSLYFTSALFSEKANVTYPLSESNNLKAIREENNQSFFCKTKKINQKSCSIDRESKGKLIGIGKKSTKKIAINDTSFFFNKHFGGGVIGSQPYILTNIVENYGFVSDGGVEVPRVWATAILKDFLCISGPSLKLKNVHYKEDQTNHFEFRTNRQCTQCHDTIDQMAGALRNFYFQKSPDDVFSNMNTKLPFQAGFYDVDKKLKYPMLANEPIKDYYLSSPETKLYFTNQKGKLVNIKAQGVDGLAKAILKTDEFYQCMSSRYLSYFYRKKPSQKTIDRFGKSLKKHLSLKVTISEILKSKEYWDSL